MKQKKKVKQLLLKHLDDEIDFSLKYEDGSPPKNAEIILIIDRIIILCLCESSNSLKNFLENV